MQKVSLYTVQLLPTCLNKTTTLCKNQAIQSVSRRPIDKKEAQDEKDVADNGLLVLPSALLFLSLLLRDVTPRVIMV
jgi:hypothetical protein